MNTAFHILLAVIFWWCGFKLKLIRSSASDVHLLITLVACMHLVSMAEAYRSFGLDSDLFYSTMAILCYIGLLGGFWVVNILVPRPGRDDVQRNALVAMGGVQTVIIVFLLATMVANYVKYWQKIGTLNPLAGLENYFTSGNITAEMWDTDGARMFGADRGAGNLQTSGGFAGRLLDWLSSRLAPVAFLLIGLLEKRRRFPFLLGYIGSSMLESTAGYFARTTVLMNFGIIALYYNDQIRQFSKKVILLSAAGALLLFLVLHLARLGQVDSIESLVGDESSGQLMQAATDTFEPLAFGMIYYERLGANSIEENVEHFSAFVGSMVPRFVWPSKPYYAFEPDVTMKLFNEDISASNVVRTYAITGEGLIVGGLPGVLLMSFLYAVTVGVACRMLERRDELCVFRYFLTIMSAYFFRLSLSTYYSNLIALGIIPVVIVYLLLRPTMIPRGRELAGARR